MFKKNTAVTGFPLGFINATTGAPVTAGTPTGTVTLDGGVQAAIAGAFVHEGNGLWTVNLLAGEMNGTMVGLTFSLTNAINVFFTIKTVLIDPDNATTLGLTNLDAAVSTRASPTNITAGTITTATNVTTVNGLAAGVITAASIAADAITDAKVAADVTIASVTGAVGSVTGAVGSVTGSVGSVTGAVGSVTAGVTVTTNNDKTGYALTQAFPANFSSMSISVTTGLVDITQAAADKAWGTAARVLTAGTNIALAKGTGVTGFNDLDAAGVAAATWNAATVTYGSAGSYGLLFETNLDAAITSRMATFTQPAGFLAATFPAGTVANTTNITAGTITTTTNLTNAPTAGDLTAAMIVSVKAQAVAALNTDTYAEPVQGAPLATTTLSAKIGYLYKNARNKKTQTSTTFSLFNDDGITVDHKSTVSDDATTATRAEVVSGP